jgi:RNA polymerase sigma factor (sigma-70 family)
MPLVRGLVHRRFAQVIRRKVHLEMEKDLLQVGQMALLEAYKKYDPNRGAFPPFAQRFVMRAVLKHVHAFYGAVKRPHPEKLKDDDTLDVPAYPGGDEPDSDETRKDNLASVSDADIDQWLLEQRWQHQRQQLEKLAAATLNDRETRILRERYLVDEPQTLKQVGDALGITAERVRQIANGAVQKLRVEASKRVLDQFDGRAEAHRKAHATNSQFKHLTWAARGGHQLEFAAKYWHLLTEDEKRTLIAVSAALTERFKSTVPDEIDKGLRTQLHHIVVQLVQRINAVNAGAALEAALSFKPMKLNSSRLRDTVAKAERLRRADAPEARGLQHEQGNHPHA